MNLLLPRSSLLTIYKWFVRPHLDYGDVIYDEPNNSGLSDKIKTFRGNTAIQGTSKKEKLYQELRLESFKDRRWLRQMPYFYKIISTKLLYLYELIPPLQRSHWYPGCLKTFRCRSTFFQNPFLPFTITEWKKWDSDIKNISSHTMFCKKLLIWIRPLENDTYEINDPFGVRLLSRFRLDFSHLRKHKFRHNFADTFNPSCSCSLETEDTEHYFLHFQNK